MAVLLIRRQTYKPLVGLKETFASIKGLRREEVVEVFQSKAAIVKVLSFKHR